jgi:3'-phosphoadenosine 5'-phosphosulfate sulfotransferase (PAPS reductase)/FAD synthetase
MSGNEGLGNKANFGEGEMRDPFLIKGPALISFSGGRTSAYMLSRILQAHGGTLPPDVVVAFANTGKEREETLRFVHECGSRWGVPVRWLEFITDLASVGPAGRFEEVGFNSASRKGEPLDRLILRKQSLFSTMRGRWCTERCKVGVLIDFAATLGLGPGDYTEVIGYRADERDRVVELPLSPRNQGHLLAFPLAEAGVRKPDVLAWWSEQPFDLRLRRGTGNCDHCPFLSDKARIARARLDPDGLDWWHRHEEERHFSFGRMSIADIRAHVAKTPTLELDDMEAEGADSECVGWCAASFREVGKAEAMEEWVS